MDTKYRSAITKEEEGATLVFNQTMKPTLRQKVYESIKELIITCNIEPGQILNEGELAQHFQVSKTPIREALGSLKQLNLVELIPRKGYLVKPVNMKDIQEILDLRLILELAVTVRAINYITAEEIKHLKRFLEIECNPNDYTSLYNYVLSNKAFHMEIARCSRNDRLVESFDQIMDESMRIQFMDLDIRQGERAWNRDHEQIINALENRDKEAVEKAVKLALEEARSRLLFPHDKIAES